MTALAVEPGIWEFQKYGTASDPTRKSDIASYTHCPRRFRFIKDEEVGRARDVRLFGITVIGQGVHTVLQRALPWVIREQAIPKDAHVRKVYWEGVERALASENKTLKDLIWARSVKNPDRLHKMAVTELMYFFYAAPKRIAEIIGVEVEGRSVMRRRDAEIHTLVHIDLLFYTHDKKLVVADYKSGTRRPSQFKLNHGYEGAIYCQAVAEGEMDLAVDGEVVPTKIGKYPDEFSVCQVQDFVPAQKDSTRQVWMRDECEHFAVKPGQSATVKKGMQRGPGWYRGRRSMSEMSGAAEAIGQVVGSIRMGRFFPILNDDCNGCRFRDPCVAEGFGADADPRERRRAEAALRDLPELTLADDFDV